MRKIIAIGESVLDTVFRDNHPVSSFVGGRIVNAAASMASAGMPVEMVSECCNDYIGDMVIDFLKSHGVGTSSVDRFTDGSTAASMLFYSDKGRKLINFYNYPDNRFDVVWPRINEDDVILFGSFYSIDTALRERLYELVKYAHERKAILIYLLGCQHGINCRITKLMPGILENLEMADIVIATNGDIAEIFPGETPDQAFKNHIEFYSSNFLYVDDNSGITVYFRNGDKSYYNGNDGMAANPLGWQAGLVSGIVYSLFGNGIMHDRVDDVDETTMKDMINCAIDFAGNAAADLLHNCIDNEFASAKAAELKLKLEELEAKE